MGNVQADILHVHFGKKKESIKTLLYYSKLMHTIIKS